MRNKHPTTSSLTLYDSKTSLTHSGYHSLRKGTCGRVLIFIVCSLSLFSLVGVNLVQGQQVDATSGQLQELFRENELLGELGFSQDKIRRVQNELAKQDQANIKAFSEVCDHHLMLLDLAEGSQDALTAAALVFTSEKSEAKRDSALAANQYLDSTFSTEDISRLNQLLIWKELNSTAGLASLLSDNHFRKRLAIDETQAAEIQKSADELQAKFEIDLAKLREKYRKKLNRDLSSKQKKKLGNLRGRSSNIGTPPIKF